MPLYQRGDVRIRYEESGSGFPLLVTPGGGLNSRVSNWPTAVFNAMEAARWRSITPGTRSHQLGLMDHLGIHEFLNMGYCIGDCFAGKLLQRAPDRVVAAVFCQTVGHKPEDPSVCIAMARKTGRPAS
jgi:pimeloyl-ACP methyl ester carboxylesterase